MGKSSKASFVIRESLNRFSCGEKPWKVLEWESPPENRLEDNKTQVRIDGTLSFRGGEHLERSSG